MIAIIETGGKQYLVTPNQKIQIEKVSGDAGGAMSFDRVLLTAEEDGSQIQIGTPMVQAQIAAIIDAHKRDRKIIIRKFKNKVRYRRTAGHRQHHTHVTVSAMRS